jgi:ubiquinone/menaquinone biosynthesis C-methylase UbiE
MTTETFDIPLEVAELYEERFVPALFAECAPHLVDFAGVGPGDTVLDVACGTGIVARTAAGRLGTTAGVVGIDRNEAMLTVARRVAPDIEWRQGDVGALPVPAGSFDRVLCQMALFFFPDPAAAVAELVRVTAPGGSAAVLVPASIDDQPAYGPFVASAVHHTGPEAASLLGTYWRCGDLDELAGLFRAAGATPRTTTRTGTARFPSVDAFVSTEIDGTPLGGRITPEQRERVLADARRVLAPYVGPDGVAVPIVEHLVAT